MESISENVDLPKIKSNNQPSYKVYDTNPISFDFISRNGSKIELPISVKKRTFDELNLQAGGGGGAKKGVNFKSG